MVSHAEGVAVHRIAFVIFPGFQSLDLTGPFEVFAGANQLLPSPAYELQVVASPAGPVVRSESGLSVMADTSISDMAAHEVDTLIVVGGRGVMDARHDAALTTWIRSVGQTARVASVCSGTFVLAETGLIDGQTVTTHWARARQLADEYPTLTVDPDPVFIRNGRLWTSAGVTAGIDLALAMVEADHGASVAQTVARWLVMFLRRPGSQSQFAAPVWSPAVAPGPIRVVQDKIQSDPSADLSVSSLAAAASMSERNLLRVFSREVGCSPSAYVERIRVDTARRLLEERDDGVEVIARAAGFGTAETMRRIFIRRVGVSPTDYRHRFTMATKDRTSA